MRRLGRKELWLAAIPALLISSGLAWLLLPKPKREQHSPPAPGVTRPEPGRSVHPAPQARPADPAWTPSPHQKALSQQIEDEKRPLPARTQALKRLSQTREPRALLLLLEHLEGPGSRQVRAMTITALAAYLDDSAVRGWVLTALEPSRRREERLLVLSIIAQSPKPSWSYERVRSLLRDADPSIRQGAQRILKDPR